MNERLQVGVWHRLDFHLDSYKSVPQAIAPKYFETKFLKVFVESVPWLVEKLKIQVLPCVICFVDGIAKERSARYDIVSLITSLYRCFLPRLIGFEDLGNSDDFDVFALEVRLQNAGTPFGLSVDFNRL